MNANERAELEAVKRQVTQLSDELRGLEAGLKAESQRLVSSQQSLQDLQREHARLWERYRASVQQLTALESQCESPASDLPPLDIAPMEIQPLEPTPEPPPVVRESVSPGQVREWAGAQPPPLPPVIVGSTVLPQAAVRAANLPEQLPVLQPAPAADLEEEPALNRETGEKSSAPPASFEMRLGTYWLVRVGVVMLLTGLVFFGNYAYKNFIGQIGPAGKLGLLYLLSGGLLGTGFWLHRRQEQMRNYAQVLIAGGLAAVYFTTYAAYHVPALQVISSAWLDGVLLIAWAGFMVWLADRHKSEVLALFGIGLAYYAAIMTRTGYFTLYSNLVLTIAAVYFLVRNRWAALSIASLAATYAGYVFWRFLHGNEWRWASPSEGLWSGVYFLVAYWGVFTGAVFLSRHPEFTGKQRASFLTFNNGAFFGLFLLTMLQVREGGFWKFALSYGSALIALAVLAARWLKQERLVANAYLTQGLTLATLGFIAYFAGLRLALVLGAESVMLIVLGSLLGNRILLAGSGVTAAGACIWGLLGLLDAPATDRTGLLIGPVLGAMFVFDAAWSRRSLSAETARGVHPPAAVFSGLALVIWGATTWTYASPEWLAPLLALEALVLTASCYVLALRELVLLSQVFLLIAQFYCVTRLSAQEHTLPWWNPAIVLAVTLALSHWWQRQRKVIWPSEIRVAWQVVYALGIVVVSVIWLKPQVQPPVWLALSCALAVGGTIYAAATRAWVLLAAAQLFVAISVVEWLQQLYARGDRPEWFVTLMPMVTLAFLALAALQWLRTRPPANAELGWQIGRISLAYRVVAIGLSLLWVAEYIPARDCFGVLMLCGVVAFALSGWRSNIELLVISAVYSAAGLVWFWRQSFDTGQVYWLDLLAIVAGMAQQRVARRFSPRYPVSEQAHTMVMIVSALALWRFVSQWVVLGSGGGHFYLTVAWALLALVIFGAGFLLHERIYRYAGLGILACALGRVALFDVWKLETVYRILSFMALGVVLVVLGFIYNKYQEKIRQWM